MRDQITIYKNIQYIKIKLNKNNVYIKYIKQYTYIIKTTYWLIKYIYNYHLNNTIK